MNFADQWNEISEDIDALLKNIASNGMTESNSKNIKEAENEIFQVLSLIPTYLTDFNLSKNNSEFSKAEIDSFADLIDRLKKQAELALTILNEFQNETSSIKMQNIIYTWELRNEII